ncbi:thiamine phosphate synthase [Pelagibacterales bacterium SAG-MED39]|nr:thiamine phosphate synthase [Pelagibacterales bacterium SAG-MED39]
MIHDYNIYYFIDKFDSDELLRLDNKINIIYRNYEEKNDKTEMENIVEFCKKNKRKIFISNQLKIALNHDFNGLYIPAFNKNLNFKNINLKKNFKIIGSAHNLKEIRIKEKQGCEEIFVSPLFKIIKKKGFLNISRFNYLCSLTKKNIIALGGINKKNFNQLNSVNSNGFASISWIKKNRPIIK